MHDHAIVRAGLQQIIESASDFEVVGQATDGEEAVRMAVKLLPDVVVMAVIIPKKDGVEACQEIMNSAPDTRVVMLTALSGENTLVESVAAGATGYLQKETDTDQLLSALRTAAQGNFRLPPEIVKKAFMAIASNKMQANPAAAAALTPRELKILISYAAGMYYAQIAEDSGVKTATIRNAIYGIKRKLEVSTMQELVLWCVKNGLI